MHSTEQPKRAGNRRTGQVTWERDIRPSDATFLAEKCKCPMYVDTAIWDDTSMSHADFLAAHRPASKNARPTFDGIHEAGAGASPGAPRPDGDDVSDDERPSSTAAPQLEPDVVTASCLRAGILCAPSQCWD